MPLHLQPESDIPLYAQLRDQMRALVYAGELQPGDRIPASRELADQLQIHRTTVATAYAELESEGLIEGFVGRGTYISMRNAPREFTPPPRTQGGPVRWEALFADERTGDGLSRLMPQVADDTIAFVSAKPSEGCFPIDDVRKCANEVLKREGRDILQLGATDGYEPLREVLLKTLAAEGIGAKESNLLVTDGCQQSLDLLAKAFLRPGDAVIVENPTYPGALSILSNARVRCLPVAVETSRARQSYAGLDVKGVEAALEQNLDNRTMRHLDRDSDLGRLFAARRHQPVAHLRQACSAVCEGSLADNFAISCDEADLMGLARPVDADVKSNIGTHDATSRKCSGHRDADQSLYWRSWRNSPLDLHRGQTHRGTRPPQVLKAQGAKGRSRQASPSGQSTNKTSFEHVKGTGGTGMPDANAVEATRSNVDAAPQPFQP